MSDFLKVLDKKKILARQNLDIIPGAAFGQDMIVPRGVKSAKSVREFVNSLERHYANNANVSQVKTRIDAYGRMDSYGSFSSRALDSYANESLGVMKSHLPAIKFSINDKEIEHLVRKTLEFNNLFSSTKIRDDVRLLAKYGEIASTFTFYPDEVEETSNAYSYKQSLKESISNKDSRISKPLQPEQIHINYISPANYDLEAYRGSVYKMNASGLDNREYLPYEFSYGCLRSEEFFPRGESVLERARIPFEVLSVSEQLMFQCRVSKVDRLVVKYPLSDDPVTDLENSVLTRSFMENARWYNSFGEPGGLNRNSDTALNSVLFIPDSITLDNIRSSIDVSQIDDVQYLQDKYITCLGLPKGYLLADDSPTRGESLIEQDLSFAQRIPYIQTAYLDYVHNLLTKIAFFVGANMNTLKISLYINTPHRLTSKSIEDYTTGMNLIKDHIAFRKEINPDYKLSDRTLKLMVQKVGLDPEIFDISTDSTPYTNSGGDLNMSSDGFGGSTGFGGEPAEQGGFGNEPTGFNSAEVGTQPATESQSLISFKSKQLMKLTESSSYEEMYMNIGDFSCHFNLYKTFLRK